MDNKDIYAITEVYYILKKLSPDNIKKIPIDLYKFFEENYDEFIYSKLNINNSNINNISLSAKLLLKIVSIFLQ